MITVVIGDIHGCYDKLIELMNKLNENKAYNPDTDRLIFVGDYIDRGEKSLEVVQYVRNLQKNNKNVIPLMGNHEDMLIDWNNKENDSWAHNGCESTLASYKEFPDQFQSDIEWMKTLPLYYEDDFFIYVHAGIDCSKKMSEQNKFDLIWIRQGFIYSYRKYDKRIIFGHTPTLYLEDDDKPIKTYTGNVDIDTGCVYGGKLTALIIENSDIKCFYQV